MDAGASESTTTFYRSPYLLRLEAVAFSLVFMNESWIYSESRSGLISKKSRPKHVWWEPKV